MIILTAIISFILGSLVTCFVFSKREFASKEEIIKLKAKIETSESLQDIIKRDFVQLANETIKNEQEDSRNS